MRVSGSYSPLAAGRRTRSIVARTDHPVRPEGLDSTIGRYLTTETAGWSGLPLFNNHPPNQIAEPVILCHREMKTCDAVGSALSFIPARMPCGATGWVGFLVSFPQENNAALDSAELAFPHPPSEANGL